MKTESYKWWEEVQSKLHQNFNNIRLGAEHVLWLSENFPPDKCEQALVIGSLPSYEQIEDLWRIDIDRSVLINLFSDKEKDLVRAGFIAGAKTIICEVNKRRQ